MEETLQIIEKKHFEKKPLFKRKKKKKNLLPLAFLGAGETKQLGAINVKCKFFILYCLSFVFFFLLFSLNNLAHLNFK